MKLVPGGSRTVEWALALAKKGFHVFPIAPKQKEPPLVKFKTQSSNREISIQNWWAKNNERNIGIYTGRFQGDKHLVVVDIDVKHTNDGIKVKDGNEVVEQLKNESKLFPDTFEQSTPSGGRHLFYWSKVPLKQGVDVLGKGIDIRAEGGYVVAAGSFVNGKYYEADFSKPIEEAPGWLVKALSTSTIKQKTKEPDVVSETPQTLDRVVEYLTTHAPIAVKGGGGDQTTFKVAAEVKDFGVSAETCLELMLEHWNPRCPPGWSPERLQSKIDNAYNYGRNSVGLNSPEKEFDIVEDDKSKDKTKKVPNTFQLEYFQDIKPNLLKPALVEKLLGQGELSVVYGESNKGKSFIALTLGLFIAQGRDFYGKKVSQGGVVYVSAEGPESIRKRIAAFKKHHKIEDVPFALLPNSMDLRQKDTDSAQLINTLEAARAKWGAPVQLVIIDTLARTMASGNENSSEDMGAFIANLDQVKEKTQSHVLVVHHAGKDSSKGARGHSSLRAAVDTEIEVLAGVIKVRKQRDTEIIPDLYFSIEPVDIGVNSNGSTVTSAILVPTAVPPNEFLKVRPKSGSRELKALEALEDISRKLDVQKSPDEHFKEPSAIDTEVWKTAFCDRYCKGQKLKTATDSFNYA
ncbi:AAA family ATPase, partial [bacterium]|nr:AAA family ATPase [bacterium]